MFIKKSKIPAYEMKQILSEAGHREETIIKNAKWIFSLKDGRYYKFVMPNPDYGKRLETTKSFYCVYDRKHKCFRY